MPQVQNTQTITVDDKVFEVASMSPDIQNAVMYMDEWRQREADLTSKLLMARAAINDIQKSLLTMIQEETAKSQPEVVNAEPEPTKATKSTRIKKVK